jgi:LPS-assembly protein
MTRLRANFALVFCLFVFPRLLHAQVQEGWEIEAFPGEGWVESDLATGTATATNGVLVKYGGAVMTAERVTVNEDTGEAVADGHVRVQRDEQIWASEHLFYNFKTGRFEAAQFRTGKPPMFAGGGNLVGNTTNQIFATNAFITTDDISSPAIKVRAKYMKIIPGKKIEARQAVLYVEGVPMFYFPFYSHDLGARANHFNFIPGYRSSYGPFLLSSYTWYLNNEVDAVGHMDYRERRGPGVGPDINYHYGKWGDGSIRYYYTHDQDPGASSENVPEDRQRIYASYQANPATNLYVKALARYQTDTNILRDFLESEYRENPQPDSFLEVNRFWQNFSLDTYAQPRFNDFLETVERLPEVRLTGFRQQLGETPFYYESQSSVGYYRRLFAKTNDFSMSSDYEASRADSFHQLLLPYTFFGWLNVTPRIGGRATYYSDAAGPGATTEEATRGVVNTGAEVSFKASQVWPGIYSSMFQADGLRHIIQPSVNYVYVPSPNYHTNQLPQFDYELPSLRLLPVDFPDYNAIDSIDSQNVLRLGLLNKLQTKRLGEVANLINWDLYTDWRLQPRTNQTCFSDFYSDMTFKPRSWVTVESLVRYDPNDGIFRMAYHSLTLQPSETWSWTISHFYLHDDTLTPLTGLGEGNNLISSTVFYRLNENWGLRATHRFEARDGRLQEQAYSIYRDLRSWTTALTFRVLDNPTGPEDFTVAVTFSLKAFPHYGFGSDIVRPASLLGG